MKVGLLPADGHFWAWATRNPLGKCKQCMFLPRLHVEGLVLSSLASQIGGAVGRAGKVKMVGGTLSSACPVPSLSKAGQNAPSSFPGIVPPPSTSPHLLFFLFPLPHLLPVGSFSSPFTYSFTFPLLFFPSSLLSLTLHFLPLPLLFCLPSSSSSSCFSSWN